MFDNFPYWSIRKIGITPDDVFLENFKKKLSSENIDEVTADALYMVLKYYKPSDENNKMRP